MNSVDVGKIIQEMKTITNITDIVGQNIFFGTPIKESDINTDIYIVINIVSQVPTFSQRQARLEFRFLGSKDTVKLTNLINICGIVTENLSFDSCNGVKDFNGFSVSSFIEGNEFLPFRDNNNRNLLIKDYIVTFFKDEYE